MIQHNVNWARKQYNHCSSPVPELVLSALAHAADEYGIAKIPEGEIDGFEYAIDELVELGLIEVNNAKLGGFVVTLNLDKGQKKWKRFHKR